MSASLARFLRDFSEPELPPVTFVPTTEIEFDDVPEVPLEPPVDVDAGRAEAFAEGRAAAEAEIRAEYEARIAEMEETHTKELEAARAEGAELLSALSGRVFAAREEIIQEVSASALNALLPLLDEMLAEKAIENLAEQIRDAFSGDEGIELCVHGPMELTGKLEEALEEAGFKWRHIDADGPDLTVERGDMIFATRLSAWIAGIRELLQ